MKRFIPALLMAALTATCLCPAAPVPADAAEVTAADAAQTGAQIDAAFDARTQALPCGFTAAKEDFYALTGSRGAYPDLDCFLYINGFGALTRRAGGSDVELAASVSAITHVSDGYAYILINSAPDEAEEAQGGSGWDEPVREKHCSAPDTDRELNSPMDWARINVDGGEPYILMRGVTSVPVVMGGYAYALGSEGQLMRADMNGGEEILYAPDEGVELRLSPAPGGVICARYSEGLLTGCCMISDGEAQSAPLWTAGAEFYDGYALSYGREADGAGRKGLYIESAAGERLIDADASSDWLIFDGKLYYWHADPEQAYGFRDLMCADPLSAADPEAIPAGEQLRARLIPFDGAIYMTNYDSELYRMDDTGSELEYAMDLSTDYDFNSDLMPDAILYNAPGGIGALIYLDEGDGWRYICEIVE